MPLLSRPTRLPRPQIALLLTGIAGTLPGLSHATNGYFAHGYGVKAQAVAGAGIALPQDALAAATNPAGTAFVGDRADGGLNYFVPDRGANVRGTEFKGNGKQAFFIPEFGYSRRIHAQTSLGLAIYGNGGMNTEYPQNPFGAPGKAGVNLEQLFIAPSLAYKLDDHHTLGVALNVAYQRFSAQGIPFGAYSSDPGHLSDQGTDSSAGAGVRLGWIGQLTPQWRVGATWASKISGKFEKYKGLFADGGQFDIPASYGLGLAFQPSNDWTFAADYQVIAYSGVKSVSNPLSQLTVEGQPLGSANGPGFGWEDVKVLKLGVVHQWRPELTLRAGYSHASQAVPASQTLFNILAPGVVQDHLTAGFTWKADAHAEWSAFYGRAFKRTVNGQQSIPAGFGGGEANVHLKEDILGVSYGWKF